MWIGTSVTKRGTLGVVLLCSPLHQTFDEAVSLLSRCWCWSVGRERLWWWVHPLPVILLYHPASMSAWLSSAGISHQSFLPHFLYPSLCSEQESLPWDCSTIPKFQLPISVPSRGPASLSGLSMAVYVYLCLSMAEAKTVCLSFHSGCHRGQLFHSQPLIFPLWLRQFLDVLIGPRLQFPHPLREVLVLLTLLFFPLVPSSYQVLQGPISSFLLVRYFYQLSAGVLHTLLCLKVYFWCMKRDVLHVHLILHQCSPTSFHLLSISPS